MTAPRGTDARDEFALRLARVQRPLFAYILSLLPDTEHADEILQSTNLKLLAERDRISEIRSFEGWARKLAHFEYLAHRKRMRRRQPVLMSEADLVEIAEAAFDRSLDSEEQLRALANCREKLPDGDRNLLAHRYAQGRSIGDIADLLGRSPGAIRQVLYRIRTALLRCIQQELGGRSA